MAIFDFQGKKYNISPSFLIISEIEKELGSIPEIINSISNDSFKLIDITTMMHIILSSLRVEIDYNDLGDEIIKNGAKNFITPIFKILNIAVNGVD